VVSGSILEGDASRSPYREVYLLLKDKGLTHA